MDMGGVDFQPSTRSLTSFFCSPIVAMKSEYFVIDWQVYKLDGGEVK